MNTITSPTKAEKKVWLEQARARHHNALLTLYKGTKPTSGLALWRKLVKLERIASDAATAQCNGTSYSGQPFRNELEWSAFRAFVKLHVRDIFGALPDGFLFNSDPRGYALKLDPENCTVPEGMEKDCGGYGCLAAQINF